jgi:hypothetical protein
MTLLRAWWSACLTKRQELELRNHVDEATMRFTCSLRAARGEAKELRCRARRVAGQAADLRARCFLSRVWGAWTKFFIVQKPRKGDTVLHSGAAARQAKDDVAQLRAHYDKQMAALQQEASQARSSSTSLARAAAKDAQRFSALVDKQVRAMERDQDTTKVLEVWKAWLSSVHESSQKALRHALSTAEAKKTSRAAMLQGREPRVFAAGMEPSK